MSIILFDDETHENLKPLTLNKLVSALRIGIFTIEEKWNKYLNDLSVTINSSFLPDAQLVQKLKDLKEDEALYFSDILIAFKSNLFSKRVQIDEVSKINHLWDLFLQNATEIKKDILLIKEESKNVKIGQAVVFNEEDGPIYIGNNVTIMDGALLRGPIALCDGAVVKMGAKIYGGTTVGVKCTVGGEIKNSILQGYSNKAHDGYLGNSVIGEWCNLGAGTSNSNVKNTAGKISVWDESSNANRYVGNKMGVCMGDYVKTAINTSITTGATIGVGANVFCAGLTPNFIPHFCWGIDNATYQIDKLIEDTANWKAFKNEAFSDMEKQLIRVIFESLTSNPS